MSATTDPGAARFLDPRRLTPRNGALFVLVVAFATIAGAWGFEYAGYLPCELCLQQRIAYYAGVPLAAIAVLATAVQARPARPLLVLLGLLFAGSAIFGVYHSGVEWGFWPGPTGCTGAIQRAGDMNDFMKQLQTVKVVRCDAVAIRIFGLSLAGWNAVISAIMAGVALKASRAPY